MKMNRSENWNISRTDTFWRDIAPGEHVLQIYEDTESFIKTLAAFVGTGINAGDSVIIIADPRHVELLESKLKEHTIQLGTLADDDRFIVLDAKDTLSKFMVNGFPSKEKFTKLMGEAIRKARGKTNRRVRAFGEMVALLWDRGDRQATLTLEEFWDTICKKEGISLFCAYPRDIFAGPLHEQLTHICQSHSRIIRDSEKPLTEVIYQNVTGKN